MLRNLLTISLLLSLGIFGLAACGNNNESAASTAETTAAGTPEAAVVPATPTPTAAAIAQVVESPTPTEGERAEPTGAPGAEEAALETGAQPEAEVANSRLNLNEATPEQLQTTIPNFGDRMTIEFLEHRPYTSIQQFRQEIGEQVDAAQVAEYEQYVYVPVDINEADAETLQQIPGVDEAVAAELIAGRPYDSNQAFLDRLAEVVPGADLATAESYLVSQ